MSDITEYTGESVKALKKVNPTDLKFTPMQLNKTFYMYSGSTSLYTPLNAYYIENIPENNLNWGEQNLNGTYLYVCGSVVSAARHKSSQASATVNTIWLGDRWG